MPHLLLVMAGGALGAGARFLLGRWTLHQFGSAFPWGTFAVNLLGGFAMGLLVGWLARHGQGGEGWRLFLGIGLLGGFTTFSAFSLEIVNMVERGAIGLAALYALASVLGAVAALLAGLWIVRIAA
ncbi:MAG: fluoride efflux transporter CrcB [Parasphingopyxis sp.]